MAESNRQVAPVRKLVAAVLGTLATFIILFGAGMSSWRRRGSSRAIAR